MAKVYIEEYANLAMITNGQVLPAGTQPALATQTVAIGGSSTQSSAFNAKTKFIRVHTDAICSYSIDTDPTASASTPRMAANTTEYFSVRAGDKIAIITNT